MQKIMQVARVTLVSIIPWELEIIMSPPTLLPSSSLLSFCYHHHHHHLESRLSLHQRCFVFFRTLFTTCVSQASRDLPVASLRLSCRRTIRGDCQDRGDIPRPQSPSSTRCPVQCLILSSASLEVQDNFSYSTARAYQLKITKTGEKNSPKTMNSSCMCNGLSIIRFMCSEVKNHILANTM